MRTKYFDNILHFDDEIPIPHKCIARENVINVGYVDVEFNEKDSSTSRPMINVFSSRHAILMAEEDD